MTVWHVDGGQTQCQIFPSPKALWLELKPDVLAVDVPIGLSDTGTRDCDREARRLLGRRSSCVFTPPCRANLHAESRQRASEISQMLSGKGVAAQHYGIYPFVRDWDQLLTEDPEAASRCYEVHPELIFRRLNGGTPVSSKHQAPGLAHRKELLTSFGALELELLELNKRFEADFLDASAALWTAQRIHDGVAVSVIDPVPRDAFGLASTMWV